VTAPQNLDEPPNHAPTLTVCEDPADVDPAQPRWEPDNQMIAAILSSPKAWRGMTQLCDWDRAWLVAGLTLAGMTAKDIAERLDCSLRLVRSIRAEDRTQACVAAQQDNHLLTDDLRTERCEHGLTRSELAEALRLNSRLQMKLDQIVDKLTTGRLESFPCGCPRVDYNMYRHDGRAYCRQCRSDRQAKRRNLRKATLSAV